MYEPDTFQLERSSTAASLAPQAGGLVPAPDGRGARRQRRRRQPMEDACLRSRPRRTAASRPTRRPASVVRRATRPLARPLAAGANRLRLSGRTLDPEPHCRGDSPGIWRHVPSRA
jgi:hypothetical protein